MEATTCEPSSKLTRIWTVFLHSMKDEKLKEKWSVAPASKMQRLGFLPLTLDECEFRTKGELETKLTVGVSLDCWSNDRMLLYFSRVKLKEDVEPLGEAFDSLLTVATVLK